MNSGEVQSVVAIAAQNSCDYIAKVFHCMSTGKPFVSIGAGGVGPIAEIFHIESIVDCGVAGGWYQGEKHKPDSSGQLAQVAFSSGTEGEPKAILISHGALSNTVERLVDIMEMDSDIREYIGVPVYHSFGFGRCRAVSAVGGKFYIPEHGFDPLEIADLLAADSINAISAVPSLWRLILDSKSLFVQNGHKLRWIEIGSQYMSAAEKSALKGLFPKAKIVQHYGLTEASRSTFLKIHECKTSDLESVGAPCSGVEVRINNESLIQIKGPHLSSSIVTKNGATELVDADGWLSTSDLGHMAGGCLYFDGRKDDMINCGGIKLVPEALENSIKQRLNLSAGIAIFGVKDPMRGEIPILAVEPSVQVQSEVLESAFLDALFKSNVNIGNSLVVYPVVSLPVTVTGKIKRKALAEDYQNLSMTNKTSPVSGQTSSGDELTEKIVAIWKQILGIKEVKPTDSFFDLGGDSLSSIRVTIEMEMAGIPREVSKKIFQGYSIAQIVADVNKAALNRNGSSGDELTEKIVAIWKQVLGINEVKPTDSFFDLGGDSLSSIRVTIEMEMAGIPREVSKKIFQGYSVAQIVADANKAALNKTGYSEQSSITPLAMGSHSLNVVRGVLVLLNVIAHWMPGVLARIHPFFTEISRYLAPLYSSGTPGFAVVFGSGIGYFIFPRFQKSASSINSLALRNAAILAVGILCLGLIRIFGTLAEDGTVAALSISNSFFSVLTYYLAACLSLPIWLRILSAGSFGFFANALILSAFSYAVHLLISEIGINPSGNPYVQPFVLLLTAKYNYFEMTSGVFLGAAFGHLLRTDILGGKTLNHYYLIGFLFVALSIFISFASGEEAIWFVWPKGLYLWTWFFYAGLTICAVVALYVYLTRNKHGRFVRNGTNLMAIVGVMAFPLFIAHELVIPLKDLLAALGVPAATPISMSLYFAVAAYLVVTLYRVYYGNQELDKNEL